MNGRIEKERYLRAFLIGFIMMAIAFVPFLITTNPPNGSLLTLIFKYLKFFLFITINNKS